MPQSSARQPWLVSKVSDGFRLVADCVPEPAGVEGMGEDTCSFIYFSPKGTGPVRLSIAVIRVPDSTAWHVRVAWPGAATVQHLDNSGNCRGCGRRITDVKVTEDGGLVIGHVASIMRRGSSEGQTSPAA